MTCDFRWSGPGKGPFPKERKTLLRCACTAIGLALIVACNRAETTHPVLRIEHEIVPQPVRVGSQTVILRVTDGAGRPVPGAHIGFEADMSHPGMSPVFGVAKEVEPGRYQAQVEFGMAGDWVILLHIALPGGQAIEKQIDVKGVRPK